VAWRQVAVTLVAAAVFAAALVSYLLKETRIPDPPRLVETSDAARGPDDLELGQRAAGILVSALAVGDFEGAYAQMAEPYRRSATVAELRAAWSAPMLAGPRNVKLGHAQSTSVQAQDGGLVRGATFTARGALTTAAGALDASFTFLREGDRARVLAVFVGGVPIVQGIGGPTR
jgi:hypothetical protein